MLYLRDNPLDFLFPNYGKDFSYHISQTDFYIHSSS